MSHLEIEFEGRIRELRVYMGLMTLLELKSFAYETIEDEAERDIVFKFLNEATKTAKLKLQEG